jgi:WD40 repeat protein
MSSDHTTKDSHPSPSSPLVIARQLSDFHISKLMFSPFFEDGLVSCGRENIRFWRMKKGHLPGRPVQLNEFSRGYLFTDLAYANAPPVGSEQSSILEPCVFVASSLGLLLRVDCRLEQVVCAYQLHHGPIKSLAINTSFAVTGGDDCRMRIWPLHFTDFLMEAQHEAPVTHTTTSQNNRYLTVGTSSGTLGVLDVLDHRYWTVLRSHVGSVTCLSSRLPVGEEFMTLGGGDQTIRLWDLVSGQQKFEFDSPQDTPLCGAYHPFAHLLACGFTSGVLRIFDVQTTSTLFERSQEVGGPGGGGGPLVKLVFSHASPSGGGEGGGGGYQTPIRLYTLSLGGKLTAYDTNRNYLPIRTISMSGNPWESASLPIHDDLNTRRAAAMIHLTLSKDNQFLAACCGSIGSLTIFDTTELVPIHRGTTFHKNLSMNSTLAVAALETHSHLSSSSPLPSTSSSLTNIGNPSTSVRGLIFCLEKSDRSVMSDENTLLIVTDKNFISITIPVQLSQTLKPAAVLESSYAVTLSSDDVSWKRIEGGVRPVSGVITRDHPSGLVFMAIRRSGGETRPEESHHTPFYGDALAIVGVTCRRLRDPKTLHLVSRLTLTPMQVITDLPGDRNLLSLTPCGPASNKILAADHSGCISVWYLREDRIEALKSKSSLLLSQMIESSPIEEFVNEEERLDQKEELDHDQRTVTSSTTALRVGESGGDSSLWGESSTRGQVKKINLEHDFDDELERETHQLVQKSETSVEAGTFIRETIQTLFEEESSESESPDTRHEHGQHQQQQQQSLSRQNDQWLLSRVLEQTSVEKEPQSEQQQGRVYQQSHEGREREREYRKSTVSSRSQQKEKRIQKSDSTLSVKEKRVSSIKTQQSDETSNEEKSPTATTEESADGSPFLSPEESLFRSQPIPTLPAITLNGCGVPGRLVAQEISVIPSFSEPRRLLVTSNKIEVLSSTFPLSSSHLCSDLCGEHRLPF